MGKLRRKARGWIVTPFSKTPFSENDPGPDLAGADPQKSRPRRPLEDRKRGNSLIALAGWGVQQPPICFHPAQFFIVGPFLKAPGPENGPQGLKTTKNRGRQEKIGEESCITFPGQCTLLIEEEEVRLPGSSGVASL